MIEQTPSVASLFTALHGAQGKLKGVHKDKTNPHFKNKYAPLDAVLEAARLPLQENGLCISQSPGHIVDGCIEITTTLAHVSGEWMRSTLQMPVPKRDPQGVGAAITYGLRYSLMAMLGIPPTDDDDAESAMPKDQGGEPGGVITDQQADNIRKLLKETKGDVGRFLAFMKSPSVSDIPASRYQEAVRALAAKRSRT